MDCDWWCDPKSVGPVPQLKKGKRRDKIPQLGEERCRPPAAPRVMTWMQKTTRDIHTQAQIVWYLSLPEKWTVSKPSCDWVPVLVRARGSPSVLAALSKLTSTKISPALEILVRPSSCKLFVLLQLRQFSCLENSECRHPAPTGQVCVYFLRLPIHPPLFMLPVDVLAIRGCPCPGRRCSHADHQSSTPGGVDNQAYKSCSWWHCSHVKHRPVAARSYTRTRDTKDSRNGTVPRHTMAVRGDIASS